MQMLIWAVPVHIPCLYLNNWYLVRVCFFIIAVDDPLCLPCLNASQKGERPTPEQFDKYLPFYLKDNPETICTKGWEKSLKDLHNVFTWLQLSELFRLNFFYYITGTFEAAVGLNFHLPNLEKRRKWRILTLPKTCDYLKENTETKCTKG